MAWDPTINLGSVLTAGAVCLSAIGAVMKVSSEFSRHTTMFELNIKHAEEELAAFKIDVKDDLKDIKTDVKVAIGKDTTTGIALAILDRRSTVLEDEVKRTREQVLLMANMIQVNLPPK